MDIHEKYIRRSFVLARLGLGSVAPNPLVGAIVVKNGKVIAEGHHQCCGGDHAERNALRKLATNGNFKNCARGTTIYISLEPCSHQGRTPPCTDLLIEAGIKTVYFAIRDPHPAVRAKDGVAQLEAAGITVHYPILEAEARDLNKAFFTNIEKQRPYVIWKAGMSLDGKIATARGESKWITGEISRVKVQELRYTVDAVLVGANTVIKDNPSLECRLPDKEKTLIKIILGNRKAMPKKTKLLKDPYALFIPHPVDLEKMLKQLYHEQKVCSILVEGGGAINDTFLRAGLVDEFYLFIAPKIIGGKNAVSVVGGKGFNKLTESLPAKIQQISSSGEDILIHGFFN
jgi:diaminohydroxyphosphoribosylaminopyrimidine deaminase / 5-amino-6-(5-phosphoribosylamino)uracil reductase